MWFFFAFLILPLIEFRLFFWVAAQIGLPLAILLCLFTSCCGVLVLRMQGPRNGGLATLFAGKEHPMQQELPAKALFNTVCLAMAGGLLIIPGFFTDILGVLLLLRPVRSGLYTAMGQPFGSGVEDWRGRAGPPPPRDPGVIDGEFTRIDDGE